MLSAATAMSVTMATRVAGDQHEPLADGEKLLAAVLAHDHLAGNHLRQQRHVVGQHADLALQRRQRDHLHVLGEHGRVRRDDFELQGVGHRVSSPAISSMPPFM